MRFRNIITVTIAITALTFSLLSRSVFCSLQKPLEFDLYSNQQLGISFNKPANWKVSVMDGTIVAEPSDNSQVKISLYPIFRAHPKMHALSIVKRVYDLSKLQYPDLSISDKRVNESDSFAELTANFTSEGRAIKGFYIISIDGGRGIFCGYETPVDEFDDNHTILRNILKTLKIMPVQFYNATRGSTIDIDRLASKMSPDGSMFLVVPPDWKIGGGNFALAATSPDEKMGITATGGGSLGEKNPYDYLINMLFPFYKYSNTVVHERKPDYAVMNDSRSKGYTSVAEIFTGETTQASGQKIYYWIMVNVARGVGFVNTIGFYATPELFKRNKEVLYVMVCSIYPNRNLIMRKFRDNLDRLKRVGVTIGETNDLVIETLRSNTANMDRVMDKYNYYLSGEEARFSPLENRIYVVDSNLESYAGNPHYPQEMLSTVPDNLWNKLTHERD